MAHVHPEIDESIAAVQELGAEMDAIAAQVADDNVAANVSSWHATQAYWIELADKVDTGTVDDFNLWLKVGRNLGSDAGSIGLDAKNSTLGAQAARFLSGLPSALSTVTVAAVMGVSDTAATAAAEVAGAAGKAGTAAVSALALPLLLVVGAIALAAYLLTRSGVRVNAGAVALG